MRSAENEGYEHLYLECNVGTTPLYPVFRLFARLLGSLLLSSCCFYVFSLEDAALIVSRRRKRVEELLNRGLAKVELASTLEISPSITCLFRRSRKAPARKRLHAVNIASWGHILFAQ